MSRSDILGLGNLHKSGVLMTTARRFKGIVDKFNVDTSPRVAKAGQVVKHTKSD